MPNETLRKFQVFRNEGTPIIGSVAEIKERVASLISGGALSLKDGELIDIRYQLTQDDTEIKSLIGVAYVDRNERLSITWAGSASDVTIAQGNKTYATIQLGVTENPTGTWTITSTINPSSLNFKSTHNNNGTTTYTLQVKNNTSNDWVDTSATFNVDDEKFVDSMTVVAGNWDRTQNPPVFTESQSGTEYAIKLIYSIGGTSSTVYVEIPGSVYLESITGGSLYVAPSTQTPTGLTPGNTYIKLDKEDGTSVYVDVTSLVNVITSVTGESSINGTGTFVAVHATTTNGAVALTSELKHSTVSVDSNADSLSGTDGVLTNSNLSAIESYVDNYDCGTFQFGN